MTKVESFRKNEELLFKVIDNLGYDQSNDSMKRTAQRYSRFLVDYKKKTEEDIETFKSILTTFIEDGAWDLIIKRDIKFNSMCEHHILPFVGTVDIAYLPNQKTNKIIGTSKLTRIVNFFSSQLQIQENLTREIAEFIKNYLDADAVWVIMTANHMCEWIRGVKNKSEMVTSTILGKFEDNMDLKREAQFLLDR